MNIIIDSVAKKTEETLIDLPNIREFIDEDEKVIVAIELTKVNNVDKKQRRYLIMTDSALYNIKPFANGILKVLSSVAPLFAKRRRIEIKNVSAITISSFVYNKDFIIHVDSEYDYYFSCESEDELYSLISTLSTQYQKVTNNYMPLYVIDSDTHLKSFCSTEEDVKEGSHKKPQGNYILLTETMLQKKFSDILANKKDYYYKKKTIDNNNFQNFQTNQVLPGTNFQNINQNNMALNTDLNSQGNKTEIQVNDQPDYSGINANFAPTQSVLFSALNNNKTNINTNFNTENSNVISQNIQSKELLPQTN